MQTALFAFDHFSMLCWRETSKDGNREDCSFETLKAEPRPLKARKQKQKQIGELGRNKHDILSRIRA